MKKRSTTTSHLVLWLASVFVSNSTTASFVVSTRTAATTAVRRLGLIHPFSSPLQVISAALRSMSSDVADERPQPTKVLWQGSLFGRLTKTAKHHLIHQKGWTEVHSQPPNDKHNPNSRLALIWPNKSGPQFDLDDALAAHIRPYPKYITDALDDKVRLAQLLHDSHLMPKHFAAPNDADPDKLYFVKHRYGAQGKSVYVMNRDELLKWRAKTGNALDFVIQEEIVATLYNDRKFVLRSHILLWHSTRRAGGENDVACNDRAPLFQFHFFDDVIVQHHAMTYDSRNNKASQISNAGKNHPMPMLLNDLPTDHPAACIYPQLWDASTHVANIFATLFNKRVDVSHPTAIAMAPDTTCFALLGIDWLLQAPSLDINDEKFNIPQIKLCEINSHPALGWGTMSKVPASVFTRLVEQTLDLLIDAGECK